MKKDERKNVRVLYIKDRVIYLLRLYITLMIIGIFLIISLIVIAYIIKIL